MVLDSIGKVFVMARKSCKDRFRDCRRSDCRVEDSSCLTIKRQDPTLILMKRLPKLHNPFRNRFKIAHVRLPQVLQNSLQPLNIPQLILLFQPQRITEDFQDLRVYLSVEICQLVHPSSTVLFFHPRIHENKTGQGPCRRCGFTHH